MADSQGYGYTDSPPVKMVLDPDDESQAIIAMIEGQFRSLFIPLGVALQDGRYSGMLTVDQIIEHLKALAQTAERIRRGDHRQPPQT